jgi:hypothetical protein
LFRVPFPMDEFYMFLIIGLLTITAMVVLMVGDIGIDVGVNGTDYGNGGGHDHITTTTYHTVTTVINRESDSIVGLQNVETWRSIKLGRINASYASNQVITNGGWKYLFNGLLFGKTTLELNPSMDSSNVLGAFLRFDVVKTNGYGNLMIKVNGQIISNRKFTPGSYIITLNLSTLGTENRIEFIPFSSSWKIWAPSVYSLNNVEFGYQTKNLVTTDIPFMIYQDETSAMGSKKGRIVLDLDEHTGNLSILLNGEQVYSGTAKAYESIYFDESKLKVGQNNVGFYTEDQGDFEGNATMIVYYDTTRDNEAFLDFVINQSDYDKLKTEWAVVKFTVSRITNPGGLTVINEDESKKDYTIAYDLLSAKDYYFYFNSSQSSLGKNTIRIKSVDNSVFYVRDLAILR